MATQHFTVIEQKHEAKGENDHSNKEQYDDYDRKLIDQFQDEGNTAPDVALEIQTYCKVH